MQAKLINLSLHISQMFMQVILISKLMLFVFCLNLSEAMYGFMCERNSHSMAFLVSSGVLGEGNVAVALETSMDIDTSWGMT